MDEKFLRALRKQLELDLGLAVYKYRFFLKSLKKSDELFVDQHEQVSRDLERFKLVLDAVNEYFRGS